VRGERIAEVVLAIVVGAFTAHLIAMYAGWQTPQLINVQVG
jgi:hypothetical protein